jgi:hypothetical protein
MEYLFLFILPVIGAAAGAYFGAYLKKKAENLATHEDIDKLIQQVSAVTQATKEIEASVSSRVWERQRSWEITKETFLRLTVSVGKIMDAAINLDSTYRTRTQMALENKVPPEHFLSDALDRWAEASAEFDSSMLIAELVCGPDVKAALSAFNIHIRRASGALFGGDVNSFQSGLQRTVELQNLVVAAIRKELGLTPQSSGSSPTQATAPPARG